MNKLKKCLALIMVLFVGLANAMEHDIVMNGYGYTVKVYPKTYDDGDFIFNFNSPSFKSDPSLARYIASKKFVVFSKNSNLFEGFTGIVHQYKPYNHFNEAEYSRIYRTKIDEFEGLLAGDTSCMQRRLGCLMGDELICFEAFNDGKMDRSYSSHMARFGFLKEIVAGELAKFTANSRFCFEVSSYEGLDKYESTYYTCKALYELLCTLDPSLSMAAPRLCFKYTTIETPLCTALKKSGAVLVLGIDSWFLSDEVSDEQSKKMGVVRAIVMQFLERIDYVLNTQTK